MSLPRPSDIGSTPAVRIGELRSHLGHEEVALRCAELLRGVDATQDPQFLLYLGGRHATRVLAGKDRDYWPRVWAARALRYAWSPTATGALVAALLDPSWRVAEMAAKVAWLHELGEAADAVVTLASHELPRVRTAAVRALGRLGEHEHVETVLGLVHDFDPGVRRAADRALALLEQRLDTEVFAELPPDYSPSP